MQLFHEIGSPEVLV